MIIGRLRYHDGDGHDNVQKNEFAFFQYRRDFSNSWLTLSNVSELLLSRIPKNRIQVQKEKENLAVACLRPL